MTKRLSNAEILGATTLVPSYTRFALKLFKAIAQGEPDKNIFISPLSIAVALALLYNGATGQTRDAISNLLELGDLGPEDINPANASLLKALNQLDPKVALTLSNRVELGSDVSPKATFLQVVRDYFGSDVTQQGDAGSIKLVNTIHFKGKWTTPFDFRRRDVFTLPNGARKACDLMPSPKQYWAYYRNDQFELVRLPYGTQQVSMLILLPGKRQSLSRLVADCLTHENWEEWLGNLVDKEGEIRLPPFELDFTIELNAVLKRLGIEIAFDPARASFGALCASPAYVGAAAHTAHVEVDEKGTVATAETAFILTLGGSVEPEEPFSMRADRPFLYAIHDDRTGALLFLGQLVDPPRAASSADGFGSTAGERGYGVEGVKRFFADLLWICNLRQATYPPTDTQLTLEQEQQALPDILDLIATSLSDGLTFVQAMEMAYQELDSEISRDIGRACQEIRRGKGPDHVLLDLADRVANPDFTLFIQGVSRALRANENLLDVVRLHAQRIRLKYPKP